MPQTSYRFGDFELNCGRFELRRKGRLVKLERIPMDLLILLAEKDGDVVSRQEIVERLWGKDVFVDTEHGINTAIRKIRTALGEDAEKPRFVHTVLGKGYRLVADKRETTDPASISPEPRRSEPSVVSASDPIVIAKPRRWWPIAVTVIMFFAIAGALLATNTTWIRQRLSWGSVNAPIRSIAVLPLVNLSGDASQDYFAEGLTDELITMLAKNSSLRVVSRTSAMQYKGVKRPLPDIARELGVDGILEGSVSKSPTGIHLTVQLIYAPSDTHVWANSYDRSLDSVYALPSELSYTIAEKAKIAASSANTQKYINPEAHDAYLRGRFFWFADDYDRSLPYMEKAVELQPDYAAAWSGLADTYTVLAVAGMTPAQAVREKAESSARKAVALDPSLAEAHNALAAVLYFFNWDWKAANEESLRAIQLDPNRAESHHLRSYILGTMQRSAEALQEQQRSTELDPFARPWALGRAFIQQRQYDAAINELRLRKEARPQDVLVRFFLAEGYRLRGQDKEYVAELIEATQVAGDKDGAKAIHQAFERGGDKAISEWMLSRTLRGQQKHYVSPIVVASRYAKLKRKEESLKMLEAAYSEHSAILVFLQNEPIYDFLHSDPRYQALVQKMGLPAAY